MGINEQNVQYTDVWDGKIKEMPINEFVNRFDDPNHSVGFIQTTAYSFATIEVFEQEQEKQAFKERQNEVEDIQFAHPKMGA